MDPPRVTYRHNFGLDVFELIYDIPYRMPSPLLALCIMQDIHTISRTFHRQIEYRYVLAQLNHIKDTIVHYFIGIQKHII